VGVEGVWKGSIGGLEGLSSWSLTCDNYITLAYLHVTVLNAVVHHLNEVAGAAGAHEGNARAVHLRGHLGHYVLNERVRLGGAAGHHGRACVPNNALLGCVECDGHLSHHVLDERVRR